MFGRSRFEVLWALSLDFKISFDFWIKIKYGLYKTVPGAYISFFLFFYNKILP